MNAEMQSLNPEMQSFNPKESIIIQERNCIHKEDVLQ